MDTRPSRPQVIQSCDVFVDARSIIYSTDYNGGLSVIEYLGVRAKVNAKVCSHVCRVAAFALPGL